MDAMGYLWNYDYIQMQAQQRQQCQIQQVIITAQKLQDFLDSADKVDEDYKLAMVAECSAVLLAYAKKHHII